MTARGPLGLKRPFASQQLEINFIEGQIEYVIRGPLGVRRRFAHPNPGATDEDIALCMASETGQAFIQGLTENSLAPPQDLEQAQEWLKSFCEGTVEGVKSQRDEEDMFVPVPEELQDALERARRGEIEVEMNQRGELPDTQ